MICEYVQRYHRDLWDAIGLLTVEAGGDPERQTKAMVQVERTLEELLEAFPPPNGSSASAAYQPLRLVIIIYVRSVGGRLEQIPTERQLLHHIVLAGLAYRWCMAEHARRAGKEAHP